jgi:hypothetical protein
MSKAKFTPTKDQLAAAKSLFMAMAFHEIVKPINDQFETEILATGQYSYDPKYFNDPEYAQIALELPEDRILRDPQDLYMIAGMDEQSKNNYSQDADNDCARYYKVLRTRMLARRFVYGENAETRASNEVTQAERKLVEATTDIHKVSVDALMGDFKNYKKMEELLAGLFATAKGIMPSAQEQMYYTDCRIIPDWLFIGTYPNCYSYADRTVEEHGDYKSLGRVYFKPLSMSVFTRAGKYQCIEPIIKAEYERIKENIDTPLVVSGTGQTVQCYIQQ